MDGGNNWGRGGRRGGSRNPNPGESHGDNARKFDMWNWSLSNGQHVANRNHYVNTRGGHASRCKVGHVLPASLISLQPIPEELIPINYDLNPKLDEMATIICEDFPSRQISRASNALTKHGKKKHRPLEIPIGASSHFPKHFEKTKESFSYL